MTAQEIQSAIATARRTHREALSALETLRAERICSERNGASESRLDVLSDRIYVVSLRADTASDLLTSLGA